MKHGISFLQRFLAQSMLPHRYRGVEVMSMADGWVEAEFEAIFREHYERIVRVTRRVLRSTAEAEEVCAEVFFRLYRAGPSVTEGGLVGGWLYRTATRAAIDLLRANDRRGSKEQLDEGLEVEKDPAEGPLHHLLRKECIAGVRAVLAKLKKQRAQLLLLRYSGLSYQEIAEAMQVSANSVGSRLARAENEFSTLYERQRRRKRSAPQLDHFSHESRSKPPKVTQLSVKESCTESSVNSAQ
jgi:RNA polymerase sigma factor (sigma-70 family)